MRPEEPKRIYNRDMAPGHLTLDLPVNPIPKARPRVTSRGTWTPNQDAYTTEIWARLPSEARGVRMLVPVEVEIHFWRRSRSLFDCDGDNLEKAFIDALQGCGLINDDRQVRAASWRIHACGPDVQPRILCHVRTWHSSTET